jgi:hypothetical protein
MSKWTTEFGCPTTRFVIDGPHLQGQAQVFHTWISNKFRGTFFKKEASRILTDESPKWPGETHLSLTEPDTESNGPARPSKAACFFFCATFD